MDSKILGEWKTVDDETQEEKSNVRIQRVPGDNEMYEAVISKLLKLPQDTKLKKGRFEGMNAVGSKVIWDLVPYENYWSYGTIMDPMSGSEYSCSVWFENDNYDELFVRGKHWTGLFRTQKWFRLVQKLTSDPRSDPS
jgi:uncharacterized protein (DUF2147 family)